MVSLMVQGVSSGAGKSLVACGLCWTLARRGVRVAPFKAQNMSNNARVVDGGEIGTAQWLQALAAGVAPGARMNPVLLKPRQTRARFESLPGPWRWLSGREVTGYEIRHGHSQPIDPNSASCAVAPAGLAFAAGNVLGLYLHGIFETPGILKPFAGTEPPALDAVFDQLADALDANLDQRWLADRLRKLSW